MPSRSRGVSTTKYRKSKEAIRRWNQSAKGKAANKRYTATEKCRLKQARYEKSAKGKAKQSRYAKSLKGKARTDRYTATPDAKILRYLRHTRPDHMLSKRLYMQERRKNVDSMCDR